MRVPSPEEFQTLPEWRQIRICDALFGQIIRSADQCFMGAVCRSKARRIIPTYQCAHIKSRDYMQIRWDISNAVCLCAIDHAYFTFEAGTKVWEAYIEERLGEGTIDRLMIKANNDTKQDLAEVYAQLQIML